LLSPKQWLLRLPGTPDEDASGSIEMRNSIPIHWIAEAEARSVREKAVIHRATSEPCVRVLYAETHPTWFERVRAFFGKLRGIMLAAQSALSTEVDPDRVLVTVLITDIVESTKLVAEIGDRAWRALLDRHDNVTRGQFKRFGGREVGNRGEGFVGIFGSPARAVRCAAAITETIAPLGISIRCGIHVGEVHVRREEISGIAVHIAARIAAEASPGEAVVSRLVRDLVAGSGLVFEDRGIHQLRGLPKEIHLYTMRAVNAAAKGVVVDLQSHMRA
jgi:class 3 adenylate cyclase